jgi:tellurite resistance protein
MSPMTPSKLPPTLFVMPFGLASLAGVWRLMSSSYGAPWAFSDALFVTAACAWVVLGAIAPEDLRRHPGAVEVALRDPVLGPFWSLPPIVGMLLATGVSSDEPGIAEAAFLVFFAAAVAVSGLQVGRWLVRGLDRRQVHPGYFLPTVAGFLIGAQGAAGFGLRAVGWISFTIAIACWGLLVPVVLVRLRSVPLPAALAPTRAIELAVPALAGAAYFDWAGAAADPVACAFLIGVALVAAGQLRLIPSYARLRFGSGFWAFTISCVSVAALAVRWLAIEHPTGGSVYAMLVAGAVSLFVTTIAGRSLLAIRRGELFHDRPSNRGRGGSGPGQRALADARR